MARVTVNDCLEKISNHFELILLASKRAKDIINGSPPAIDRKDSSTSVLALREISENKVDPEALRKALLLDYSSKPVKKEGAEYASASTNKEEKARVIIEEDAPIIK